MPSSPDRHQLKVTVKKFEGKFAVLETSERLCFSWPIKDLPDDVEVGTRIRLIAATSRTDEQEREQLAKAVLNAIINE